jgi:uncharacterized membrane protein (UPF0127 family)
MKRIILTVVGISLIAVGCNNKSMLAKEQELQIKQFKLWVQLADTPEERAKGLSGIPAISDNEGMLFLFSEPDYPSFWMKDMKFPIDIIWINGNKIVGITDNVKVESKKTDSELRQYIPPAPADKVLEVNSGWSYRKDIAAGDTIKVIQP